PGQAEEGEEESVLRQGIISIVASTAASTVVGIAESKLDGALKNLRGDAKVVTKGSGKGLGAVKINAEAGIRKFFFGVGGSTPTISRLLKMQARNLGVQIAALLVRYLADEMDLVEGDSLASQAIGLLATSVIMFYLARKDVKEAEAEISKMAEDGLVDKNLAEVMLEELGEAERTVDAAGKVLPADERAGKVMDQFIKNLSESENIPQNLREVLANVNSTEELLQLAGVTIDEPITSPLSPALEEALASDGNYKQTVDGKNFKDALQYATKKRMVDAFRANEKGMMVEIIGRGLLTIGMAALLGEIEKDHTEGDREGVNQTDRANLFIVRGLSLLAGITFNAGITALGYSEDRQGLAGNIEESKEDSTVVIGDKEVSGYKARLAVFGESFKEGLQARGMDILKNVLTLDGTLASGDGSEGRFISAQDSAEIADAILSGASQEEIAGMRGTAEFLGRMQYSEKLNEMSGFTAYEAYQLKKNAKKHGLDKEARKMQFVSQVNPGFGLVKYTLNSANSTMAGVFLSEDNPFLTGFDKAATIYADKTKDSKIFGNVTEGFIKTGIIKKNYLTNVSLNGQNRIFEMVGGRGQILQGSILGQGKDGKNFYLRDLAGISTIDRSRFNDADAKRLGFSKDSNDPYVINADDSDGQLINPDKVIAKLTGLDNEKFDNVSIITPVSRFNSSSYRDKDNNQVRAITGQMTNGKDKIAERTLINSKDQSVLYGKGFKDGSGKEDIVKTLIGQDNQSGIESVYGEDKETGDLAKRVKELGQRGLDAKLSLNQRGEDGRVVASSLLSALGDSATVIHRDQNNVLYQTEKETLTQVKGDDNAKVVYQAMAGISKTTGDEINLSGETYTSTLVHDGKPYVGGDGKVVSETALLGDDSKLTLATNRDKIVGYEFNGGRLIKAAEGDSRVTNKVLVLADQKEPDKSSLQNQKVEDQPLDGSAETAALPDLLQVRTPNLGNLALTEDDDFIRLDGAGTPIVPATIRIGKELARNPAVPAYYSELEGMYFPGDIAKSDGDGQLVYKTQKNDKGEITAGYEGKGKFSVLTGRNLQATATGENSFILMAKEGDLMAFNEGQVRGEMINKEGKDAFVYSELAYDSKVQVSEDRTDASKLVLSNAAQVDDKGIISFETNQGSIINPIGAKGGEERDEALDITSASVTNVKNITYQKDGEDHVFADAAIFEASAKEGDEKIQFVLQDMDSGFVPTVTMKGATMKSGQEGGTFMRHGGQAFTFNDQIALVERKPEDGGG
ncbi:MAG: hypothetical protein KC618_02950, partial [Candidatus Omnitrophica bacterium]|nr:hypothetical protein [Candidatus Omnitrophota bacterium]